MESGDGDKVESAIKNIEDRLHKIKQGIEDLLMLLELQERVSWPDMIQMFCSLSSQFSSVQAALKKSGLQMQYEDYGQLLKSRLLVPQLLSLEPDPELQKITENRLVSFNHEVVPTLLRTKLNPEVENEERKLESDSIVKQPDQLPKQIKLFNGHIETMCTHLSDPSRQKLSDRWQETPTYKSEETKKLVKAVCLGTGIQPKSNGATGGNQGPARPETPAQGSRAGGGASANAQVAMPNIKIK